MSFPTLSGVGDLVALRGGSAAIQNAAINCNTNGNNTIVTAVIAASGVPAKIIRVLAYTIVPASAVTVTWESSGGSVLGGPMALAANVPIAVPFNPLGHFSSLAGEGLVLNLGSGVQVGGHVTYLVSL